jgi:hypothetical protein
MPEREVIALWKLLIGKSFEELRLGFACIPPLIELMTLIFKREDIVRVRESGEATTARRVLF